MKLADVKIMVETMIENYEGDLPDSELMGRPCKLRQVADTNIANLKAVLKALENVEEK